MTKIIQKIKNLWNKIINWIVEQYNKFLPKQLMKVVLVLLLCSSVNTVCLPPLTYPTEFKDEYTCLLKGYTESKKLLKQIGKEDVNSEGLFYKFDCMQIKPEEADT